MSEYDIEMKMEDLYGSDADRYPDDDYDFGDSYSYPMGVLHFE